MASPTDLEPSTIKLPCFDKGVNPGWTCDVKDYKCSPFEEVEEANLVSSPPEFKFSVRDKCFINTLLSGSPVFRGTPWVADYSQMDKGDVLWIQGTKSIRKSGNSVADHPHKHVVTAVIYEYQVEILLNVSESIGKCAQKDLLAYLDSLVTEKSGMAIPSVINDNLISAYIYPVKNAKGKMLSSGVKYCLREFCRLLKESEVSKDWPASAIVKNPSPLKSSITSIVQGNMKNGLSVSTKDNSSLSMKDMKDNSSSSTKNDSSLNLKDLIDDLSSSMKGNAFPNMNDSSQKTPKQDVTVAQTNQSRYTKMKNLSNKSGTNIKSSASSEINSMDGNSEADANISVGITGNCNECVNKNNNIKKSNESIKSSVSHTKENDLTRENCPAEVHDSKVYRSKKTVAIKPLQSSSNPQDAPIIKDINALKLRQNNRSIQDLKAEKTTSEPEVEYDKGSKQHCGALLSSKRNVKEMNLSYDTQQSKNGIVDDKQTKYLKIELRVRHKNASSHDLMTNETVGDSSTVELTDVHNLRNSSCLEQGKNSKDAVDTCGKQVSLDDDHLRVEGKDASQNMMVKSPVNDAHQINTKLGHNEKSEICKSSETSDQQGKHLLQSHSDKSEAEIKPPTVSNEETTSSKSKANATQNVSKKSSLTKAKDTQLLKSVSCLSSFLEPAFAEKDECGMERKYYGIVNSKIKEKVLILLGASGSGKTTLINFIANCFSGTKTADDKLLHVALTLNKAYTRTTAVTAYTFCYDEDEAPITIIDTPGLNDSSGAEVRDHVQSLKIFLANAASQNFEIHALGFVAQAHLVRLTSSERLVMDYVSTLFGQSVNDHFITFVTFADNQETPPVIEAMKSYGVNFKLFLKFNNSALSAEEDAKIDDIDRVYWRFGLKSWKKCHKLLKDLPALAVHEMKALQNEVYAATVIKSAEQDLRGELLAFIKLHQRRNCTHKEVSESSERVWELATVVKHLQSSQASSSLDAEELLMKATEKLCDEKNIPPTKFIHSLLLAPSRNLLSNGISIIRSLAPVYANVRKSQATKKISNKKNEPKTLMICHGCDKKHAVERIPTYKNVFKTLLGPSKEMIVFQCKDCDCDGNLHGILYGEGKPSEDLSPSKLLQHARNLLSNTLQEFSKSKYKLFEDGYLQYLGKALGTENQEFLADLLRMQEK